MLAMRQQLLTLTASLLLLFATSCVAQEDYAGPKVQEVTNLQQLGAEARAKKVPIMLVASQAHCAFCQLLKEEILQPMLLSGDYGDKVIIRELMIDSDDMVPDFHGVLRRQGDISTDYKVWVTPTVLYVDGNGKEMAEPVLGVNSLDYYGYYVDETINELLEILRSK